MIRPRNAGLYRKCLDLLRRIGKEGDVPLRVGQGDAAALALADEFSSVRRAALCSVIDGPLLFVKRHAYMAGHIYDDYLTWRPGGGIYVLENPADLPEKHIVRPLIDPTTPGTLGEGVYRDPDLSWDGKRLLFAFKDGASGNTSLYEIGTDGKGLRRITNPGEDCACRKPALLVVRTWVVQGLSPHALFQFPCTTAQTAAIVGPYLPEAEPGDVDIFMVMTDDFDVREVGGEAVVVFDHAAADAYEGASVFWVRRMAALGGVESAIADWQVKRDGSMRGIVEVIANDKQ